MSLTTSPVKGSFGEFLLPSPILKNEYKIYTIGKFTDDGHTIRNWCNLHGVEQENTSPHNSMATHRPDSNMSTKYESSAECSKSFSTYKSGQGVAGNQRMTCSHVGQAQKCNWLLYNNVSASREY